MRDNQSRAFDSSCVTRALLKPSRRAISARRSFGSDSNSAIHTFARSNAVGRWRIEGRADTSLDAGIRNGTGAAANGSRPDFASGKPTMKRSRMGREKFVCFLASPTLFTSSAASWPARQPFPPRKATLRHQRLVDEIARGRVSSSRGRQVPRGLKRKMSNYALRPRRPFPATRQTFDVVILQPRP